MEHEEVIGSKEELAEEASSPEVLGSVSQPRFDSPEQPVAGESSRSQGPPPPPAQVSIEDTRAKHVIPEPTSQPAPSQAPDDRDRSRSPPPVIQKMRKEEVDPDPTETVTRQIPREPEESYEDQLDDKHNEKAYLVRELMDQFVGMGIDDRDKLCDIQHQLAFL